MWGQLALTLLQQSHLCPLPLVQQPIYWQYDHALHLYPLPHAVIIGDSSPQAQYTHMGCTVINPVRTCSHHTRMAHTFAPGLGVASVEWWKLHGRYGRF